MCFSISFIETTPKSYVKNFQKHLTTEAENFSDLPEYYFVSAFDFPSLPIIYDKQIKTAKWGLIPHWVKDKSTAQSIRTKTLNAKCETIFNKPSFRSSISSKRCILGVRGFFEWQHIDNRKIPYYIYPSNSDWLTLGCIYDEWIDNETGELLITFSIVTIPANDLLTKIHNTKKRMPLILDKETEFLWLDKRLKPDVINNLFKPISSELLNAYRVSPFLNYSYKNRNVPEALHKFQDDNELLF